MLSVLSSDKLVVSRSFRGLRRSTPFRGTGRALRVIQDHKQHTRTRCARARSRACCVLSDGAMLHC